MTNRSRPPAQAAAGLASVLLVLLTPRSAAQRLGIDLPELSLEDLLNIEVTSVARREQSLSQSPSAVYVITQEEIRRSGVTTIPDALRLARGVPVMQMDGVKWGVSGRGFNGRLGWRSVRGWELSIVGQHLLDSQHLESPALVAFPTEAGRSVYGKLMWDF